MAVKASCRIHETPKAAFRDGRWCTGRLRIMEDIDARHKRRAIRLNEGGRPWMGGWHPNSRLNRPLRKFGRFLGTFSV